jgi:hypothetical protein
MQKSYRNSIIFGCHRLAFVTLLCLATFLSGCKRTEEVAPPEVSVQAEKAEQKPLTEYVSGDAILAPLTQAAIVPKISAPIKRFFVQRNSHVKRGELLAQLENADLVAAVRDSFKPSLFRSSADCLSLWSYRFWSPLSCSTGSPETKHQLETYSPKLGKHPLPDPIYLAPHEKEKLCKVLVLRGCAFFTNRHENDNQYDFPSRCMLDGKDHLLFFFGVD